MSSLLEFCILKATQDVNTKNIQINNKRIIVEFIEYERVLHLRLLKCYVKMHYLLLTSGEF